MDLLFEIYTEEIPASYQDKAISYIRNKLPLILDENQIDYQSLEVGGTCRRIFLYIVSLSEKQNSWEERKKGPPKKLCYDAQGNPTKQLSGFCQRIGIPVREIQFQSQGKEEYASALVPCGGEPSLNILGKELPELLLKIPFEKSMRWGEGEILYARPILQYFCLYGSTTLTSTQLGTSTTSGSTTLTSTQLGTGTTNGEGNQKFIGEHILWKEVPGSDHLTLDHITGERLTINQASDYFTRMEDHGIQVREKVRCDMIRNQLFAQAQKNKLRVRIDEDLINEVNFLVEKPDVLLGKFPEEFLKLPDIVITTEMREHQRYFPLENPNGEVVNQFLIVANLHSNTKNSVQNIISGNERVLVSRLSDGMFFFEEDRRNPLSYYSEKLKDVTYQRKIGNMFEKKERIKEIAKIFLQTSSLEIKADNYEKACDLMKADLTTHLVYEFDSLQGRIGSIYASLDGEDAEICEAIQEHYLPRYQGDDHPKTSLGALLSLSDKFDNLICSFLLAKEPTASHDPLGVRRQTIYIIEIIIRNQIRLNMIDFLDEILPIYQNTIAKLVEPDGVSHQRDARRHARAAGKSIKEKVWNFFRGRFASIFEKQGFDKKLIRASLFTKGDDICVLYSKLSALSSLKNEEEFTDLILVFKRMNNIIEDYKQKQTDPHIFIDESVDEDLLIQNEEKNLYHFGKNLNSVISQAEKEQDYQHIFSELAGSRTIVNSFFDHIMVMDEDEKIRKNRLSLLNYVVHPIKELFNLDQLK